MVLDQPNTNPRFHPQGILIQGNKYLLAFWVTISVLKLEVNIKMKSHGSCPQGWFREVAGDQALEVGKTKINEISDQAQGLQSPELRQTWAERPHGPSSAIGHRHLLLTWLWPPAVQQAPRKGPQCSYLVL